MSEIAVDVVVGKFRARLTVKTGQTQAAWPDPPAHSRSHLLWVLLGPDARYNAGFAYLAVDECDSFADAVTIAWDQFRALRSAAPDGVEVSKSVKIEDRPFRLITGSGPHAGVTVFPAALHSYQVQIKSPQELEQFVGVLREAQQRATELMPLL